MIEDHFENQKRSWWQRTRVGLVSYWDTDLAILFAAITGVLGVLQITSLETTVGLTLVAVAALAASLHRDRSLREGLKATTADLHHRLSAVSRAYSNPLPYDIIAARYSWTFEPGGETATVGKGARVRFVHNGVWSILTWHTDGARVHEPEARRRLQNGKALSLEVFGDLKGVPTRGRFGKLIALDRKYVQNDVLEFEYVFRSEGNFLDDKEWIEIVIETFTADLVIEIVWAEDRIPRDIWLEGDDWHEKLPIEKEKLKDHKKRRSTRIKRQNLVAGQVLLVEWRWSSIEELRKNKDG
jgi:hypothetical protein